MDQLTSVMTSLLPMERQTPVISKAAPLLPENLTADDVLATVDVFSTSTSGGSNVLVANDVVIRHTGAGGSRSPWAHATNAVNHSHARMVTSEICRRRVFRWLRPH